MAAKKKILPYAKQGWTTGTGLYNEQLNNAMKTPYSGGQTYSGVTGYDDMANKMGYGNVKPLEIEETVDYGKLGGTTGLAVASAGAPSINSLNLPWKQAADIQYTMGELVGSEDWNKYTPEKQAEILGDLEKWDTSKYAGQSYGGGGLASSFWNDTIGGAKGFADLAGGLGALGSLYTGYKQNKMAEQEHNARMGELARQRQRDADWQRDIKASGLGSYSAGMGGK